MAAGSTDSNGVYQYGSSDTNATFHGLLNIANAILSTTIGALVTRLNNDEAKLRRTVSSLAALDAITDATVGQTAFTTAPGTGVTGHSWVAVGGSGGGLDWQPVGTFVVDTKAHFDTYVAAVVAIADLTFAVGQRGYVTATGITYWWTGSAWKAWESDWITYAPTITGVTLGTGSTTEYRYRYVQGVVEIDYSIRLGTGGAFTAQPTMTLPVTARALRCNDMEYDGKSSACNAAGNIYPIAVLASGASTSIVKFWSTTAGAYAAISATAPHTWALNSVIQGIFRIVPA